MAAVRHPVSLVALLSVVAFATDTVGDEALSYTPHEVTAPDGVTLSVQEWGNPDGPGILFIHGWSQSHLSWAKQVEDPALADEFRMITFDVRGHGMSDKPVGEEYYREGERWADDLAAIIESLDLVDPVLVAWSYAGRLVGDYLTYHGEDAIGGLNLVGAILLTDDPARFGPALELLEPMTSQDLAAAMDATKRFIETFFEVQPAEEEFRTMLGFNMMTPRHVRVATVGRPGLYEEQWRAVTVPTLITHGVEDQVIALEMAREGSRLIDHAQTSFMDGIGHAPFWEDPERSNEELAELVRDAQQD